MVTTESISPITADGLFATLNNMASQLDGGIFGRKGSIGNQGIDPTTRLSVVVSCTWDPHENVMMGAYVLVK